MPVRCPMASLRPATLFKRRVCFVPRFLFSNVFRLRIWGHRFEFANRCFHFCLALKNCLALPHRDLPNPAMPCRAATSRTLTSSVRLGPSRPNTLRQPPCFPLRQIRIARKSYPLRKSHAFPFRCVFPRIDPVNRLANIESFSRLFRCHVRNYTHRILIARKFSRKLNLKLTPRQEKIFIAVFLGFLRIF